MEKEEKNKQDKQLVQQKVKEFIQSLGDAVECREGKYRNELYHLKGYYYGCDYRNNKWFFLIIDDSGDIYIETPFHFPKSEQLIPRLSETFGINLDKLKFSEIGFLGFFKLEPLPEEVLNITTDTDEINLSTANNRILIDVRDKISLLYDKGEKEFIILEIKDWDAYKKIRSVLDQDVREVLDKLSLSRPEFIIKYDYEKPLGLEGKIKEITLRLLNKLMPIIGKINKIVVRINEIENEITLNNLVLKPKKDEDWGVDIPVNEIEKLLTLDDPVVIVLHKDFWYIRVHEDYLSKVANMLSIEPILVLDPKKYSPLFYENKDYYVFSTYDDNCCGNRYHIVSSVNIEKYLQSIGVNVTKQSQSVSDSFEVVDGDYKYIIIKGEGDEVHVQVIKDNKMLTSLKTYLWYFGVKDFDGLKNLSKEKIISVVRRQIDERYFYPMPFAQLKQYVLTLINNTIKVIDEAINSVKNRIPNFTKSIKNTVSISCIFNKDCKVTLELDEIGRLSYYSLIGTTEGHLPIPIFLEYAGIEGESDEEDINMVKNMIYFIRGYDESIPEEEREYYQPDDNVRGAGSLLFQKAVVLYNKLLPPNRRKLYYIEDDKNGCLTDYYTDDEECPEYALPDGFGYCRDFDYEPLMQKSEDELANEIIESLTKLREKMLSIKEKMLQW